MAGSIWQCEAASGSVRQHLAVVDNGKLKQNVVENFRELAPGFKLALSGSFQASLDLFIKKEDLKARARCYKLFMVVIYKYL